MKTLVLTFAQYGLAGGMKSGLFPATECQNTTDLMLSKLSQWMNQSARLFTVQARYTKQQSHGICGNFCYIYRCSGLRSRSVPPEENLQRRRSTLHEAWTTVYLKRGSFSFSERDEMRQETIF